MTTLRLGFLLVAFGLVGAATAQATELSIEQEARFRALTQELRCLVCQNQNIADSNAPLAADLREQVKSQLLAGRSNDEIMVYVTARYGDFVLYRPRLKSNTLLLWLAPALLVLLGLLIVLNLAFRRRLPPRDAAVDQAALRRLLGESGGRRQ
jgi:cytochrome c-type biogenesis protein CcmH